MTKPISRLEMAANLACAAITVLFCGVLAEEEQSQVPESSVRDYGEQPPQAEQWIVPLRKQFADVLEWRPKYAKYLRNEECLLGMGGPPYCEERHREASTRLRVLLDIGAMPSRLCAEMSETLTWNADDKRLTFEERLTSAVRRAAFVYGVKCEDLFYIWRSPADLDACWKAIYAELLRQREILMRERA